jgi:O-antigen/teichoic acid export membrane protein
MSLRDQVTFGAIWVGLGYIAQVLGRLVVLGILSRLLTPTEFGLLAAALLIISLGETVGSLGAAAALVRVEEVEKRHIDSAFTLNVLALLFVLPGTLGAAALAERAGWGRDLFIAVLTLSPCLILTPLVQIGARLLQRRMAFKFSTFAEVFSYLMGYGAVGVSLAVQGYGAAALVYGHLASVALNAVLLLSAARVVPGLRLDVGLMGTFLKFGRGVAGANVVEYFASTIDRIIVAGAMSTATLGLYSRAIDLSRRMGSMVDKLSLTVLYPALVIKDREPGTLAPVFSRCVGLAAAACLPPFVAAAVVGREIMLVVFGDQWSAAGPIFALAGLAAPWLLIRRISAVVMVAVGQPSQNVVFSVVNLVLAGGLGFALASWGPIGVASAMLIASVMSAIVAVGVVSRRLGAKPASIVQAFAPAAAFSACAFAGATGVREALRALRIDAPLVTALAAMAAAGLLCMVLALAKPSLLPLEARRVLGKFIPRFAAS